jgi:hypothetical protein
MLFFRNDVHSYFEKSSSIILHNYKVSLTEDLMRATGCVFTPVHCINKFMKVIHRFRRGNFTVRKDHNVSPTQIPIVFRTGLSINLKLHFSNFLGVFTFLRQSSCSRIIIHMI